jgi:transcriptional regulator with XRE-family HTH domain
MKQDPELINLSKNLRFAASSFSSIAEICRKSGVNRQQFNKYLSGQHQPSHRVLVKLSRFFSIEERDLFMKSDDFERFYEGVESDITWDLRSSSEFIRFGPLARTSASLLRHAAALCKSGEYCAARIGGGERAAVAGHRVDQGVSRNKR